MNEKGQIVSKELGAIINAIFSLFGHLKQTRS